MVKRSVSPRRKADIIKYLLDAEFPKPDRETKSQRDSRLARRREVRERYNNLTVADLKGVIDELEAVSRSRSRSVSAASRSRGASSRSPRIQSSRSSSRGRRGESRSLSQLFEAFSQDLPDVRSRSRSRKTTTTTTRRSGGENDLEGQARVNCAQLGPCSVRALRETARILEIDDAARLSKDELCSAIAEKLNMLPPPIVNVDELPRGFFDPVSGEPFVEPYFVLDAEAGVTGTYDRATLEDGSFHGGRYSPEGGERSSLVARNERLENEMRRWLEDHGLVIPAAGSAGRRGERFEAPRSPLLEKPSLRDTMSRWAVDEELRGRREKTEGEYEDVLGGLSRARRSEEEKSMRFAPEHRDYILDQKRGFEFSLERGVQEFAERKVEAARVAIPTTQKQQIPKRATRAELGIQTRPRTEGLATTLSTKLTKLKSEHDVQTARDLEIIAVGVDKSSSAEQKEKLRVWTAELKSVIIFLETHHERMMTNTSSIEEILDNLEKHEEAVAKLERLLDVERYGLSRTTAKVQKLLSRFEGRVEMERKLADQIREIIADFSSRGYGEEEEEEDTDKLCIEKCKTDKTYRGQFANLTECRETCTESALGQRTEAQQRPSSESRTSLMALPPPPPPPPASPTPSMEDELERKRREYDERQRQMLAESETASEATDSSVSSDETDDYSDASSVMSEEELERKISQRRYVDDLDLDENRSFSDVSDISDFEDSQSDVSAWSSDLSSISEGDWSVDEEAEEHHRTVSQKETLENVDKWLDHVVSSIKSDDEKNPFHTRPDADGTYDTYVLLNVSLIDALNGEGLGNPQSVYTFNTAGNWVYARGDFVKQWLASNSKLSKYFGCNKRGSLDGRGRGEEMFTERSQRECRQSVVDNLDSATLEGIGKRLVMALALQEAKNTYLNDEIYGLGDTSMAKTIEKVLNLYRNVVPLDRTLKYQEQSAGEENAMVRRLFSRFDQEKGALFENGARIRFRFKNTRNVNVEVEVLKGTTNRVARITFENTSTNKSYTIVLPLLDDYEFLFNLVNIMISDQADHTHPLTGITTYNTTTKEDELVFKPSLSYYRKWLTPSGDAHRWQSRNKAKIAALQAKWNTLGDLDVDESDRINEQMSRLRSEGRIAQLQRELQNAPAGDAMGMTDSEEQIRIEREIERLRNQGFDE